MDQQRDDELNLESFNPFIEYDDTKSCLEFVILAVCRNMNINGLQVSARSESSNSNKPRPLLFSPTATNTFPSS